MAQPTDERPHVATCQWPDCDSAGIIARGLCRRDYQRAKREGRLSEFSAPPRTCAECGETFRTGSRAFNRFCSRECQRAKVDAERVAARAADLIGRACAWCGVEMPTDLRGDAIHCSVKCQQTHCHALNPERARDRSHRRRARLRRTTSAPIDYAAVWEREEGCCWLCRQPVDRALAHPDPLSRSWDHVIPLAAGGAHSMANLALAHLFCNISKHARLPDTFPAWWPGEEDSDAGKAHLVAQPS